MYNVSQSKGFLFVFCFVMGNLAYLKTERNQWEGKDILSKIELKK